MRKIAYMAVACAFSAMSVPTFAADESTEVAAQEKITAYTVLFSGGGWGAASKARAALAGLEGANKVLISGTCAIVTVDYETTLQKSAVRKLFKPKGLKLEKLSKKEYSKPVAGVEYIGKGDGWATTIERARVALTRIEGVSFAFINGRSVRLLLENGEYDKKKVERALKRAKFNVDSSKEMTSLPL